MSNTPWLNNAIWLTIFGAFYFRGAITSDRNIRTFRLDGGHDIQDVTIANVKKQGPVRIYDARVLLSAILVSLPAWLAPIISPKISEVLMLIAVGAFIAPLTLPTLPLSLADLKVPGRFISKWILGKLDVYAKSLVLLCICFVLMKIPGIAFIGHHYSTEAFAVVHGGESHIFEEVVKSGVAAMALMYLMRLAVMFVHGIIFLLIWGASISLMWFSLQYEANVVLHPTPIAGGAFILFSARIVIDFVNDVIETLIESIE